MTVFHNPMHFHVDPAQVRHALIPAAISVALVTFAFNALGVFGDGTAGAEPSTADFLALCGITIVAVAVVFALVLPRALGRDAAPGIALTLSILSALSVPAFWAGVTPALAVGGILLGFAGRDAAKGRAMSTAAFVLGLLVTVSYIAMYALDWMSTNGIG